MMVLPQASGAAIARIAKMIGAFQGAMPSTTPTGCPNRFELGRVHLTIDLSPRSGATSRSMFAADPTLKLTQGGEGAGSPCLTASIAASLQGTVTSMMMKPRARAAGSHILNTRCRLFYIY